MQIKDRLIIFLKTAKITQKEFAEKSKYSPQSLSKFITGVTKSPKIDFVVTLAEYYPKLNLRWLLLGEGEMLNENTLLANSAILEENVLLKKELINAKDKIITLLEER